MCIDLSEQSLNRNLCSCFPRWGLAIVEAYEQTKKRLYVDRAAGRYRHHCIVIIHSDAGLAKGEKASPGRDLYVAFEAMGLDLFHVYGRA